MWEQAIIASLHSRYGFDRIPVPAEAITVLIDRDAGNLDVGPVSSTIGTKCSAIPSSSAGKSRAWS